MELWKRLKNIFRSKLLCCLSSKSQWSVETGVELWPKHWPNWSTFQCSESAVYSSVFVVIICPVLKFLSLIKINSCFVRKVWVILFIIFWNTCEWKNIWKYMWYYLKTENMLFNNSSKRTLKFVEFFCGVQKSVTNMKGLCIG